MDAIGILLFLLTAIAGGTAYTTTRTNKRLRIMSLRMSAIMASLLDITERLQTMPTLDDLRTAVTDVKTAVDAAAQRVIDTPPLDVPQDVIDTLGSTKGVADGIAPVAP